MPTPREAISGIPNAHEPVPGLLTGGQPGASHLEALKAAGGSAVIDLRDPMEPRPIDEAALVNRLGMAYVNIPVTAGTHDDATLERILDALRANAGRPTLMHCGSGNRVGGALIAYLMLDHEMDEETATAEAMRVGLRGADLLEWGLDYVRRHS